MSDLHRIGGLVLAAIVSTAGATEGTAKSAKLSGQLPKDEAERVLKLRVDHARVVMNEAFSRMLEDGQRTDNHLAQWYNWPNWNNWGNNWRNW